MELKITNENFETLKNDALPLVIDFWATYCGPCKVVGQFIGQLAEEYAGKVNIAKCDVEECEDIAIDLGVRSVPTIIFFKDGNVADKIVGAANKAKIQEKIENLLQ